MPDPDAVIQSLQDTVSHALANEKPLVICGGGSKKFYGRVTEGQAFPISAYQGIVSYEPTELVVTVRAGTLISELQNDLASHGQMLAFEPPLFSPQATVGGMIATGLSGPRRPFTGAVRDYVLGVKCLNGRNEILKFGGQVMKNVAGFDVSRLMTGALGTLGVILEVSMKVLPLPKYELTLHYEIDVASALAQMTKWRKMPLPISALCYLNGRLYLRLSGYERAIKAHHQALGGEIIPNDQEFWTSLRDHHHPFFQDERPLWRLSLPPATTHLDFPGQWCVDWAGAQRWLKTDAAPEVIFDLAKQHQGYATLFRGGNHHNEVFTVLAATNAQLHSRLKTVFDPQRIFNPGRMYTWL